MNARDTDDDEVAELRRQNVALNEQVKRRLVRSDRQLSLSRAALGDQLRRVRLLDEYALAASSISDPTEILRLGLELLTKLFAFEQAAAFRVVRGFLVPVAMHAVGGMDGESTKMRGLEPVPVSSPYKHVRALLLAGATDPVVDDDARLLLACVDELYGRVAPPHEHRAALILPLHRRPGELLGVLVARRITRPQPYHEVLPGDDDRDVLDVVGKHLATAVTNVALVDDLRRSYADLGAAQAGLVEKERLAAVGEMSAQIAHEVRNPLGAIFNSVSRLRTVLAPTGESELLLRIVAEEAERLARIVDELLDFARPQVPAASLEGIDAVVRRAVDSARRGAELAEVDVSLWLEAANQEIVLDARMIEQAVVNLVLNAAQAMSGRGVLTVRTLIERTAETSFVRIDVVDAGCGVKAESAGRLFQPFFTTRASGTGLGLAVVKRFVAAHQGEVFFTSNCGAGTTFSIRLPARVPRGDRLR